MPRIEVADARTLLRRTPYVLDDLLRGLPEAWAHANEGPDTWSSVDVVGHLVDAEESNWIPRIRHLIEHGEAAAFPPFDRFEFEKARGRSVAEALERFSVARARSLRALDDLRLGPADLERRGLHPDFGPVTLAQLLATWTVHDLNHIGQIVGVLARQHAEAVGPWREFLGILGRT
jgi:uncharacterized damage-inducible protein DinB